jgi:hypothetical protein
MSPLLPVIWPQIVAVAEYDVEIGPPLSATDVTVMATSESVPVVTTLPWLSRALMLKSAEPATGSSAVTPLKVAFVAPLLEVVHADNINAEAASARHNNTARLIMRPLLRELRGNDRGTTGRSTRPI